MQMEKYKIAFPAKIVRVRTAEDRLSTLAHDPCKHSLPQYEDTAKNKNARTNAEIYPVHIAAISLCE